MSFILEIGWDSHQHHIADYLRTFFAAQGVAANVGEASGMITVETDEGDAKLEAALHALNTTMPYSVFMRSVSHRIDPAPFVQRDAGSEPLPPLNLGLCRNCSAEIFDPSSRRYYYPFTSCRHCGPQYAFFERYPYERANTSWSFVQPCEACREELETYPFRRGYAQISCHNCSIALEMVHGGKSRYANDAASSKQLFEIAAKAISEGKSVVMKTTFGYRRFFLPSEGNVTHASILLHCNPKEMMDDLALTRQEIEALFAIERPLLKVATQSERLKALFGNVARCKVPDEGFTLLLAKELEALHLDYVAFESCDESAAGAYRVSFDLPISAQEEMTLFVGGEQRFIRSGERVAFPAKLVAPGDTLSVGCNLIALKNGAFHWVDRPERFEGTTTGKMNLMEGCEPPTEHSNTHRFTPAQGTMMGAMRTLGIGDRAVGVFFEGETVHFLHANGGHVTTVVPSRSFKPVGLIERLAALREGSDRLVANLRNNRPDLYAVLERIEREPFGLFEAAAALIGLDGSGFDAIDDTALQFMGKGGTQVDTTLGDTRFHPDVFLSSIISYRMAGVEPVMLAYSIFESLGDYFVDILSQLQAKSKAEHVILCGRDIAQSSLYSRIVQKMKVPPPLLVRGMPLGSESAVVGGIYL